MISGLAPGKLAETEIVGKSTWGKGETGKTLKAMAPMRIMPAVNKVVATGRRMKGAEMFMRPLRVEAYCLCRWLLWTGQGDD